MSLKTNLSVNLKRLRDFHKQSLSAFSVSAGIGKSSLQSLEKGKGNPRLDTISTMETSLHLKEGALLSSPPDTPLPPLDAPHVLLSCVPALRDLPPERRPEAYILLDGVAKLFDKEPGQQQ